MKILLLVPALSAVYGGTSKTAPALAAALGRQGWTVDLIATDADGPGTLGVPRNRWIEQDGYREQYFSRVGRFEYKLSLPLLVWLWRHVGDYGLVHVNSNFNFPVLAAALACRWHRVPYLLTPHGMLEPWALGYKAWKKRTYYRAVERPWVLRGAHAIQALNAREAENIRALGLGRSVVVFPNGISPREILPGDEADREAFLARFPHARGKILLLFLHRIDPKKGLDLLARAFAAIRGQFPQTHVVVAGPDSLGFAETARGFFADVGVGHAEAVTFTGMLDGAQKRGALAAASLFVTPSYSEGFSMSVLEAMAAGLPSVLTTGCNFPEADAAGAARETAIDADAFAAALREVLADPDAAREMGARARQFVLANYTWEQVARMAGPIYEALAESTPTASNNSPLV